MNDLGIGAKSFEATDQKALSEVEGSYTYFANNDVLLAKITPCFENGKLGIASNLVNGVGFGSSEFFVFRPNHKILSDYLYYFLSQDSFRATGQRLMTGAVGHKRVPKEFVEQLEIPLPTLPEQRRIVAILDDAFAGLDAMRANAEKNLQNARDLFDSHLSAVFSEKGEGWVEKTLEEICSFSSGGTPAKSNAAFWVGDIPWVSGRDMKKDRLGDAALHISVAAIESSATRLAPVGSLLLLVRGMGLANGIAITELTAPCAFNQDIKAIHPASNIVPRFLLFCLRLSLSQSGETLSNAAHGTLKIDMDKVRGCSISLPSVQVQKQIVAKIDTLSNAVLDLDTLYRQKLAAIAELKQSILQKAFAGELTSSDSVAA